MESTAVCHKTRTSASQIGEEGFMPYTDMISLTVYLYIFWTTLLFAAFSMKEKLHYISRGIYLSF